MGSPGQKSFDDLWMIMDLMSHLPWRTIDKSNVPILRLTLRTMESTYKATGNKMRSLIETITGVFITAMILGDYS